MSDQGGGVGAAQETITWRFICDASADRRSPSPTGPAGVPCIARADAESIPEGTDLAILAALRPALPEQTPPRILALNVVRVFETLNATPPGFWASLGLLAVHAGSFLVALVMGGAIAVLQDRPP